MIVAYTGQSLVKNENKGTSLFYPPFKKTVYNKKNNFCKIHASDLQFYKCKCK